MIPFALQGSNCRSHGADEEIAALTELFLHWGTASIMVTELLSCEALNQGQFAYSFGSIY